MSGYYIGMDVGGTHLRLKLADAYRNILGEYEGPGCSMNLAGYAELKRRYGETIYRALSRHGYTPAKCLGLCVGATGVDSEELAEQYCSAISELGFNRQILRVYNDCEVFLHLQEEANMVAVAGTGSIAVGKDAAGHIFRCGGWGHLLSDEGSGFFLAKRAMEEVIHHYGGVIDCPVLAEALAKHADLHNPYQIARYFYNHLEQKSEIAKYAPLVDQSAQEGDAVAASILDEATEKLWLNIGAVARRICPDGRGAISVYLWGSVFIRSRRIYTGVERLVQETYPQAVVAIPPRSALDTALEIAFRIGKRAS